MSTTVVQAYRFALDPNPEQEAALPSHCGGQRFAFNWGLARVKANLGQRKAEQSSGLAAGGLTPSQGWSAFALRKDWNRAKGVVAPWWGENSNEACSSGLEPRDRVDKLGREPHGQTPGPKARVRQVQGQARRALVPVHHRRV